MSLTLLARIHIKFNIVGTSEARLKKIVQGKVIYTLKAIHLSIHLQKEVTEEYYYK